MIAKRRRSRTGIVVPEGTKLVAGGDGAKIIGCSRASFYRLSLGDPQFPIPVGCNARGWSLWKLEDIQQFAATWKQRRDERNSKKTSSSRSWTSVEESNNEEEE